MERLFDALQAVSKNLEIMLARPGMTPPAGRKYMLWIIFAILVVLWGVGFALHVAGALIHILLVFALITLVIQLVTGRRAAL
jgi:hypothetical protein